MTMADPRKYAAGGGGGWTGSVDKPKLQGGSGSPRGGAVVGLPATRFEVAGPQPPAPAATPKSAAAALSFAAGLSASQRETPSPPPPTPPPVTAYDRLLQGLLGASALPAVSRTTRRFSRRPLPSRYCSRVVATVRTQAARELETLRAAGIAVDRALDEACLLGAGLAGVYAAGLLPLAWCASLSRRELEGRVGVLGAGGGLLLALFSAEGPGMAAGNLAAACGEEAEEEGDTDLIPEGTTCSTATLDPPAHEWVLRSSGAISGLRLLHHQGPDPGTADAWASAAAAGGTVGAAVGLGTTGARLAAHVSSTCHQEGGVVSLVVQVVRSLACLGDISATRTPTCLWLGVLERLVGTQESKGLPLNTAIHLLKHPICTHDQEQNRKQDLASTPLFLSLPVQLSLLRLELTVFRRVSPDATKNRDHLEDSVRLLERVQLVSSQLEGGPNAAARRVTDSWIGGQHGKEGLRPDARTVSAVMSVLLSLQEVLQQPEYKDLRRLIFGSVSDAQATPSLSAAASSTSSQKLGKKRGREGLESPGRKKQKKEDEEEPPQQQLHRFGYLTCFRTSELAANACIILNAAAKETEPRSVPFTPTFTPGRAPDELLETLCAHCIVTLGLLLPFLSDISFYGHLLFAPVSLLHDHLSSGTLAANLASRHPHLAQTLQEVIQQLGHLRSSLRGK